jgi:hypothetical protein
MFLYLENFRNAEELCDRFKKEILSVFYKEGDFPTSRGQIYEAYVYTPRYLQYFEPIQRLVEICDIFKVDFLNLNKSFLQERVRMLSESSPRHKEVFEKLVDDIKGIFKSTKKERKKIFSMLNPTEIERLNEATHNFLEGCYYSSVAMSVSAIEFRLLKLMHSVSQDPELEELTLGQLITEYIKNKEKYKGIIPKKHEQLLWLCNTYRIFSVHPKTERITRNVANSILNLTFEFLLAKELKI